MRSRREFLKLGAVGTLLGFSPWVSGTVPGVSLALSGPQKKFLKACAEGNTQKVKILLAKWPELLTATDQLGKSGFVLALLAGHHQTGAFLKEAGYETDLHEAALELDWERFDTLTAEENAEMIGRINGDHPLGGCAMWAAAAGGAGTSLWRIYARCGDANCTPRGKAGSTPLQKALRYPDLSTAELTAATLLGNNADPDPAANADLPPLHIAAQRGSTALVEMLIRLGAAVDRRDHQGRLASELAEASGHQQVLHLLDGHQQIPRSCRTSRSSFNAEGDVYRSPEMQDISPFHRGRVVGASHFNLELVQQEVNADSRLAHSVATTGEKAVEAGAHMGRKELVDLLLQHGAPYSLPTAVMLQDYTTVRRLLDEDPNRIYERGAHDFPLLWYPIIGQCDLEMMQLLLDRGAQVEEQHFLGTTALHWAAMRGPVALVEMLLENGADINRSGRKFDPSGQRPLALVKEEKMAGYLRSKGAR